MVGKLRGLWRCKRVATPLFCDGPFCIWDRVGLCSPHMNRQRLTLLRRALLLACVASVALLTALLTSGPIRAEVYKWVDKDGVTHYSDRPAPGATEVALPTAQTYQAPAPSATGPAPAAPAKALAPTAATAGQCDILSPKADETLSNVPSIVVTYRGPEGTTAVLMLNNKRYTGERDTNRIVVKPAPRGAYEAKMLFLNARNEEVCKVPAVSFFVRQNSLLNPAARRRKPS
jgi:hypothetical protein